LPWLNLWANFFSLTHFKKPNHQGTIKDTKGNNIRAMVSNDILAMTREQLIAHIEQIEANPETAMILNNIKKLRAEAKQNGREIYYDNQDDTATEVVASIHDQGIQFQMVIAPCQAGKTGCMIAIIEKVLEEPGNKITPDKIFVMTGLNDTAWVSQTKERLPITNVIHRGQLKNFKAKLKGDLDNILIMIDECQIASGEKMTINKLLEDLGIKDLAYLKENNVNIVEFSATPNSTLDDIELWDTCKKIHVMKPGEGYVGHSALLENNRVLQAEDLFIMNEPIVGMTTAQELACKKLIKPALDAIKGLKLIIETSYTDGFRYHIIRTPAGPNGDTVFTRFNMICGEDYAYKKCFSGEEDLQDELKKYPEKHTFLFIKEKARCAVTFPHKNLIGILYERLPKSPKDDVIVQGLAGRACGYDMDPYTIVFTNVSSIERYVDMIKSDFKERGGFIYTGHNSNNKSHIHPRGFDNTAGHANDPVGDDRASDFEFKLFEKDEDAIVWAKKTFNQSMQKCKSKAPVTLQKNGKNPTFQYMKDRQWGMTPGKCRQVRLDDDQICVYWRPK
jgi:hypothetical protein